VKLYFPTATKKRERKGGSTNTPGHGPMHFCVAQDGNDTSEEDGNKMIAILDIIVPTSIRWWSQFFFLKVKNSWHLKKRDIDPRSPHNPIS